MNDSFDISIHAPAKGATFSISSFRSSIVYFNSRPREGGDVTHPTRRGQGIGISIHAPAKGATAALIEMPPHGIFQFTPPRRGRLLVVDGAVQNLAFQFTPPRRGRRIQTS